MGISVTIPLPAAERARELGHQVRLARIRRGMSVVQLAEKAGINRNTLSALELGKPGVALGAYITVLWALGLDNTLDAVAHPDNDSHGKTLEASRRPKRVRKLQQAKNEYDFSGRPTSMSSSRHPRDCACCPAQGRKAARRNARRPFPLWRPVSGAQRRDCF